MRKKTFDQAAEEVDGLGRPISNSRYRHLLSSHRQETPAMSLREVEECTEIDYLKRVAEVCHHINHLLVRDSGVAQLLLKEVPFGGPAHLDQRRVFTAAAGEMEKAGWKCEFFGKKQEVLIVTQHGLVDPLEPKTMAAYL